VGYRPNPLARALRGAPTMLLGAIVRDITDPFFAGAIEAVSAEARTLGYKIVLGHAHAQATEAHALLSRQTTRFGGSGVRLDSGAGAETDPRHRGSALTRIATILPS
jgi:Transcriptional regulators